MTISADAVSSAAVSSSDPFSSIGNATLMLGTGSLTADPLTEEDVLRSTAKYGLIFTAEIEPWVLLRST
jgi:hypothetical protein